MDLEKERNKEGIGWAEESRAQKTWKWGVCKLAESSHLFPFEGIPKIKNWLKQGIKPRRGFNFY